MSNDNDRLHDLPDDDPFSPIFDAIIDLAFLAHQRGERPTSDIPAGVLRQPELRRVVEERGVTMAIMLCVDRLAALYDRRHRNRSRKPDELRIREVEQYKKSHTWAETDKAFHYARGGAKLLLRRAKRRPQERGYHI